MLRRQEPRKPSLRAEVETTLIESNARTGIFRRTEVTFDHHFVILFLLPGRIERDAEGVRLLLLKGLWEIRDCCLATINLDAEIVSAERLFVRECCVHERQIRVPGILKLEVGADLKLRRLAGNELHLAGFLQDFVPRRKRNCAGT